MNAVLRHYDNSHKTVLQEFDLVGIKSISPMDKMFQPISYAIDAKVERLMNPHTENEGYAFTLKAGGGASYALSDAVWGLRNVQQLCGIWRIFAAKPVFGDRGGSRDICRFRPLAVVGRG